MKSENQTYKNEIVLFTIVFFTGFISFSYLSYSNVLVGDDWNALVQPNFLDKTTVQMGRWMHKVISDLTFDRLFAPVFTLSFLLFVNSVGVVLVTKWVSFKSLQDRFIFSVLYVNNPIWIEAYLFKMGHLPKAFALIFCFLSAYIAINHAFIRKKNSLFLITSSAFFLAFGAACYQTYAFIAILVIFLALFKSVLNKETHDQMVKEGKRRLSYEASVAALFINLYRDEPILHLPFKFMMCLIEIDNQLTNWRYRHAQMVLRMIGNKIGTGGSSGHEYLFKTAEKHQIFTDFHNISTLLIPRSELPPLPDHIRARLNFHFNVN